MTGVHQQADRLLELERQLSEALADRDQLRGRCSILQDELQRVKVARDQYQAGWAELKAQFAILITAVDSSHVQFKMVADAALRSIHNEMTQAGVDPINPRQSGDPEILSEADIQKVAAKFAPKSETPDE